MLQSCQFLGKQQASHCSPRFHTDFILLGTRNLIKLRPFRPFLSSAMTATLMTSLTTSVGFFATNASGVAGLKLFGTFCGLLVAVDYVLSVLILPPALCLYDSLMMGDSPSRFVSIKKIENKPHLDGEVTEKQYRNVGDRFLRNYVDFIHFCR